MKNKKYLKSFFIRVLLSIILFLLVGILINKNDKFLLFYKNNVYDKNFNFSFISNQINKYFGNIFYVDQNITSVNKEINYKSFHAYKDGVELLGVTTVYPLKSGIVVYIGDKEEYGSTIIIQGMDGIDYWYSNITDIGIKLYDYVDTTTVIANPIDNKLYMVFIKENEILNYEDYIS